MTSNGRIKWPHPKSGLVSSRLESDGAVKMTPEPDIGREDEMVTEGASSYSATELAEVAAGIRRLLASIEDGSVMVAD